MVICTEYPPPPPGGVTPSCALLCEGLTYKYSVCVAGAPSCALLCDERATGIFIFARVAVALNCALLCDEQVVARL